MKNYLAAALVASALVLPSSAADRKFDAEACAKAVAPYLDEQTFAVLHVDLTAVNVDALAAKAAALAKMDADALPLPRKEAAAAVKALTDAGARDAYVVVSLADVPEYSPFIVAPLPPDVDVQAIRPALEPWHLLAEFSSKPTGNALLLANHSATLKRLHDLKPADAPSLARAFAAAGGGLAQLAVIPPMDAGKIIEGVMPTLPAEVGGGSSQALTRGFRWAAVGLDAPKLKLSLTVQASDADAAKALLDLLTKTYAAAGKSKEVRQALPDYDKFAELLTPKITADRLTLALDEAALTALLRPALAKTTEGAARAESTTHLKQLVLATHQYHDIHGHFPAPAAYDKDGKPLLSWRVLLLPYLDQDALYKEFHLDEPWDGEHNKKLIARMPAVFRSSPDPKLAADGKTTYLAPLGDATMFPGAKGVRIADVTDGTSNTILLVQADDDHAVAWTKPEDLAYDPKAPMKGLGGDPSGGFLTAFADGSVHFLPRDIDKDVLRALFTRNGGEVVTPP